MVASRVELIEYCLRRLGFPVIEINVDQDQIEDRIDDALEFYIDYHFDGTERTYFAVKIAQTDIDNGYLTVPENMIFVTRALPFNRSGGALANPIGDPNAVYDFHDMFHGSLAGGGSGGISSTQDQAGGSSNLMLTTYFLNMQYFETVQQMFGNGGDVPIRFNRHTNRVYLDMDWSDANVAVDDYIILHGWSSLDPEVYTDVYNDRWIKRYATALIKRQWGANILKYNGIQLPGGVTLDGDKLFQEASDEIDKLEEEMQDKYEEPPMPRME